MESAASIGEEAEMPPLATSKAAPQSWGPAPELTMLMADAEAQCIKIDGEEGGSKCLAFC